MTDGRTDATRRLWMGFITCVVPINDNDLHILGLYNYPWGVRNFTANITDIVSHIYGHIDLE